MQNRIEKIVQKYLASPNPSYVAKSGDFCSIQPQYVMTHDNTGAVMKKFKSIGANRFKDSIQPVFTLDHNVQDTSNVNLKKYKDIQSFAKAHSVDFYAAGRGIGHQIMVEEGYAYPDTLVVASDSHSNMYGGLGCLGTPIVRTDAASIWATGKTWWQIPPVARVEFINQLPKGSTGKDVIIALCGLFNQDQVLNHAIEFTGNESITSLSIDDRLAIANMTTEWGALAGVFPVDNVTLSWLYERARLLEKRLNSIHSRHSLKRLENLQKNPLNADNNSNYALDIQLDLSRITPYISGPNSVKLATPLSELEPKKIQINKAYLVSCVNSRVSDLKSAAEIIKGHKVNPNVEFYVAAASLEVQKESEALGYWNTLLEAGAKALPPGCGPCIGLGAGLLKDNEVGISATNRNYKGRMGSPLASTYLSSPVAASAIKGYICGPDTDKHDSLNPIYSIVRNKIQKQTNIDSTIYDGFEAVRKGSLLFCDQDNLNTDGIYPGKYTYQDDLTLEQMASVVMENYDSNFASVVQPNDILICGYNFGTGSSREQAATALKSSGIQLVLAGSFSETFKRNAINNGLLVLEAPALVEDLRSLYKNKTLTKRTDISVQIDLVKGTLLTDNNGKKYEIPSVGLAAQELIVEGGLESWVRKKIE